MQVQILLVKLS